MFINKKTTKIFCEILYRELCLYGRPEIRYTKTCWAEIRLKHAGTDSRYNEMYNYLIKNGLTTILKGHTVLVRNKDIETYVMLYKLKGKIK